QRKPFARNCSPVATPAQQHVQVRAPRQGMHELGRGTERLQKSDGVTQYLAGPFWDSRRPVRPAEQYEGMSQLQRVAALPPAGDDSTEHVTGHDRVPRLEGAVAPRVLDGLLVSLLARLKEVVGELGKSRGQVRGVHGFYCSSDLFVKAGPPGTTQR